ncbi:MAG: acyltransferase [Mycobacteriales bacterium]
MGRTSERVAWATFGAARRAAPVTAGSVRRARRAALVARVRAAARMVRSEVELDLAPDLLVGRDVRVTFEPGTRNVLKIGPGSRLDDRVLIMLKGGTVDLGPRVEVRRDVILNVAGILRVAGDTPISWGSVLHCSSEVVFERMVGLAEQVTVADSSHYFTTPEEHFWHNVRTGSIRVGSNTWICPKATVVRGADIGACCIIGSGSVVTGTVPDGHLASGVPAQVRPLPLPWTVAPGDSAAAAEPLPAGGVDGAAADGDRRP